MVNVLAIEVFAASTFSWAEEVLSDPEVSDAPDDAADLVRFIRADEAPHVEYLRTALSEIQARTLLALDGSRFADARSSNDLAERTLRTMMRQRLNERPVMVRDLIRKTANVKDVDALMREFDALGHCVDAARALRGPRARGERQRSRRLLSAGNLI